MDNSTREKTSVKERILIFDGLNTFLRNYTVVPSMNNNGQPIGGLLGFLRSIKFVMRDVRPSKVIVVWDGEDGSAKRRSMYKDYKSGRRPRVNREYDFETPEESDANMRMQYAKLRQLLELLGVHQVEIGQVEADDVISYLCRFVYPETNKVVVSSDRDFYQLIDAHTLIYSPTKKTYFTSAILKEQLNVLPENYIYVKALVGDGSDNIKGIKGIGEKTAIKLFPFLSERPSDLNEIFSHAGANVNESPKYQSILDNKDVLFGNVQLMQLTTPIISPQSVRAIRWALENSTARFVFTEFKLTLIRDGIQLTDSDFFSVFKEYMLRAQGEDNKNVQ